MHVSSQPVSINFRTLLIYLCSALMPSRNARQSYKFFPCCFSPRIPSLCLRTKRVLSMICFLSVIKTLFGFIFHIFFLRSCISRCFIVNAGLVWRKTMRRSKKFKYKEGTNRRLKKGSMDWFFVIFAGSKSTVKYHQSFS